MSVYNSVTSLENKRLTIGEAVIWNSRRIEKLEERQKHQFSNQVNQSVQNELSSLQDKYNQLNTLVAKVEQRIEELNKLVSKLKKAMIKLI